MTRSMNGRALPAEGREMKALLAYIKFLGKGTPTGMRIRGMGLRPIFESQLPPDPDRGKRVYAAQINHRPDLA